MGDGFDYREQAQRRENHIGSIVRLNPDGTTPEDNPFAGSDRYQVEIYSYGHRNVQGLVYDSEQERLIAHEHGPRGGDEINVIRPGVNYGWPVTTHGLDYTGARVTPFKERAGIEPPLMHWSPSIAPSGMAVYTGDLFPQWRGDLLIGGLVTRQVHRVTLEDGQAREVGALFGELDERIRDVRTGPDGAIYLLTDSADGRVLRVTPE
ncbi:MAG TPA: PQQ-dependent sugar dehydrogenase [Thioalkalivibrio sp.]|nr:PQQ-dependent sugar dehydrogenase [Thioalkalivibrio sp.]